MQLHAKVEINFNFFAGRLATWILISQSKINILDRLSMSGPLVLFFTFCSLVEYLFGEIQKLISIGKSARGNILFLIKEKVFQKILEICWTKYFSLLLQKEYRRRIFYCILGLMITKLIRKLRKKSKIPMMMTKLRIIKKDQAFMFPKKL